MSDTATIIVRSYRPADLPRVRALLDRCSAATLRSRFFGLSSQAMQHYVHSVAADNDQETVVAQNRSGLVVGLGSVFFEPNEAELAIMVEDAWQGQGIGTAMAVELCCVAAHRGIPELCFEMLAANARVLRLLISLSPGTRFSVQCGGVVRGVVPLASFADAWREFA